MQTRKLQKYKLGLDLRPNQISVLVGSLLGDGTLGKRKKSLNANFKTEQGLKQKDYVFWKYEVFKEWVTTPPKISYRYDKNRQPYAKSWWFRTLSHPKISNFYQAFYKDRVKTIPKNIAKWLDPLVLAVWIMDDGSLNKNIINLSTYSFKLEDIKLLQKVIHKKFALESNFYKDRDKGYRMYFRKTETQKLISLISPYILPSLSYKILVTP